LLGREHALYVSNSLRRGARDVGEKPDATHFLIVSN
jgi:hypothetical protein